MGEKSKGGERLADKRRRMEEIRESDTNLPENKARRESF